MEKPPRKTRPQVCGRVLHLAALVILYLPSNEVDHRHQMKRTILPRVYRLQETKFRFSFNAALCHDTDHLVTLSFMDHWVNATKMTKQLMQKNAFVLKKEGQPKVTTEVRPETNYEYTMECFRNKEAPKITRMKYSMINAHTFVSISKNGTNVERPMDGKLVDVCTITWSNPVPRYIALFSSSTEHCPTFISAVRSITAVAISIFTCGAAWLALFSLPFVVTCRPGILTLPIGKWEVDHNFDVWLRKKRINVSGISKPPPKETTVFRDVILSCVAIVFYYYCLTSLILPAYFNFMMPVARREPIGAGRFDDEKSALRLKATAGKNNDINNNDDSNDINDKDYNNIEVSKLD